MCNKKRKNIYIYVNESNDIVQVDNWMFTHACSVLRFNKFTDTTLEFFEMNNNSPFVYTNTDNLSIWFNTNKKYIEVFFVIHWCHFQKWNKVNRAKIYSQFDTQWVEIERTQTDVLLMLCNIKLNRTVCDLNRKRLVMDTLHDVVHDVIIVGIC